MNTYSFTYGLYINEVKEFLQLFLSQQVEYNPSIVIFLYNSNTTNKKSFLVTFQKQQTMSLKGLNYGHINFEKESFSFNNKEGENIFKLKYKQITNAILSNQKEIFIETKKEITTDDCLTDMRLVVDNVIKEDKSEREDEDSIMQEEKSKMKNMSAANIYSELMKRSSFGENSGESIATLHQVNLVVPRGKYTIDFFPLELRFHGTTFDYKIKYQHINKSFFLLMPNEKEVVLVLQLHSDHPIYQGQTVHRYVVLQIKKEIVQQINTRVSPEMGQKYPSLIELQEQYNSNLYQIFVDLLSGIANLLMIHPGQNYKSKDGHPCIRANVKAQTGWLFMLKQSLIFIFKPVIYLKLQKINLVQFTRTGPSNKQFDMRLVVKQVQKKVQFTGLQRNELERLLEYFKSKDVKVLMQESGKVEMVYGQEESEQQDEDYDAREQQQEESDGEDDQDEEDQQ